MKENIELIQLKKEENDIKEMSLLATSIIREYYDLLLGKEQNDYMINLFQSEEGIKRQLNDGYNYYFIKINEDLVGFFAFYYRNEVLYLSKFYLKNEYRNHGYSHLVMDFLKKEANKNNKEYIELNVNKYNPTIKIYEKLGFVLYKEECNPIGQGYYMNDYVYRYKV